MSMYIYICVYVYIYIYVYVCLSMIDYACMYIIYHVLPENGNQKQIHLKKMPGQCGRNAPRCQSTMTAPAQPRGREFQTPPPHMPPGLLVSKAISIGLVPLRNSLEAQRSARGKQKTLILDAVFFLMVFVLSLARRSLTIVAILMPRPAVHLQSTNYVSRRLYVWRLASTWSSQSMACIRQNLHMGNVCVWGCYDDFLFVILASSLKRSWSLASRNLQAHRTRTRKLRAIGWHSSE